MPISTVGSRFRWCIALLALFGIAAGLCAQPHHKGMPRGERHEFRHEIEKLEETWRDAAVHRDTQVMDGLLADDYMGISGDGRLQSKEQTLNSLRDGTMHFESINLSDRKVRFYDRTAVVTSQAEVKGATPDGSLSGNYRYTRVYVRDPHGNWKVVSFEASPMRSTGGTR